MATKLTDIAIEAWKPDPAKRLEIGDALVPGLLLIIQPSGKKGWAVRYRHNGKPAKLTLGPLAMISLKAAREKARAVLEAVAKGGDPSADKRAAKTVAVVATLPTLPAPTAGFWEVMLKFKEIELDQLRSGQQTYRSIEREVKGRWQDKAIGEITKHDVRSLIDDIKAGIGRQRGPAPVQATRVLSYLSWAFAWAARRDYLAVNPCVGIDKPTVAYDRRRDRLLEDKELKEVWTVADGMGYPFGDMVKLLILTGCRLREVAEMEWSEIDLERRLWTVPAARAKNADDHRVALAPSLLAILEAVPRIGEKPRFVFTTTGLTPVSGFARAKLQVDAGLAKIDADRKANGDSFASRQPWVFHDLRRSVASGLARLKVPFEVVERVLAHRGESNSGLRAVYNRHSYDDEKREALTRWADHLAGLVQPTGSNVISIAKRKQR
jgi:integrase